MSKPCLNLQLLLDALTDPLARAGVLLFAISTFDTGCLLVRAAHLDEASAVLRVAGHSSAAA
jgi:hypothetical protein